MTDYDIDELKEEAASLGIEHHPNIGAAKLKERIDQHYEELEKDEPSVSVEVQAETQVDEEEQKPTAAPQTSKHVPDGKRRMSMQEFAAHNAREMRKTRIVTIIDNDKRVNDETTTAVVNCTNGRFDLGSRIIPLNERVEVRQGHIEILAAILIPQHVEDPKKPGMMTTVMRPRYSIQYNN